MFLCALALTLGHYMTDILPVSKRSSAVVMWSVLPKRPSRNVKESSLTISMAFWHRLPEKWSLFIDIVALTETSWLSYPRLYKRILA